ncbi:leukocyte receptor cluster lrc 4, putative [Pediculus humanus corporis]|uniref:Lysophospholipid acyltransferase 7 n=1 Tax=Pediculus humanus subsp. corporis TaxID=121224 RepID=E0VSQ0_PEDHC|nr:leukocyte receptor cluster lrc 4, putative [Pediculus humanus corporis]EEB16406.1 leukocyte receptor cluster lrc 4, putative [Pediculus humanus corporis]
MDVNDIIYLSLLTFTIFFGCFLRKIENIHLKKWISTVAGFSIVLSVSGIHVLHSIFFTFCNSLIILYTSKRICHIISFIYSFIYLIFFRNTLYFGIDYPPSHTNLIQMIMTLKLVGLAFEIHDSYACLNSNEKSKDKTTLDLNLINFNEIIHYTFCHIGILTGPYFSYKTFSDFHKHDFYKYIRFDKAVAEKLIYVPLFIVIFLIVNSIYPVKYAESETFYLMTTFWYRLWYIIPVFVAFRMRIYIGLLLSEAACITAGIGAYPCETEPKPGKGPTVNLDLIEKMERNKALKENSKFNYDTVLNVNLWHTETDPLLRTSILYWNMCVQYWMANIVYKRFPIKLLRTVVTFAVSALWHGVYAGYYLCLCFVPPYLFLEDIWVKLLKNNAEGMKKYILNVMFWIMRTQAFSYLGMAFSLLSLENGLRYYGSVYYIYHITSAGFLILGLVLRKKLKPKM